MSTLKEEIDHLLSKIEAELLEFVSFITYVENGYISLPGGKSNVRCFDQQCNTSENISSAEENGINGSAISDAFQIVDNVFLRIYNLLEQFASLPTEDEKNLKGNNTHVVRYYYTLYVYRIASYLVKAIQEHLMNFSNKLNELASPLSSDEDETIVLDMEKSIPAKEEDRTHEKYPARKSHTPTDLRETHDQCTCSYKQFAESSSSYTGDDRNKCRVHEGKGFKVKVGEGKPSIFVKNSIDGSTRLAESIEELSNLFQILYSHIAKITSHTKSEFLSTFNVNGIDNEKISFKRNFKDCCPTPCDECCEVCKITHQKYQEYQGKKLASPGSSEIPILTREPFWMQTDIKQAKLTKPLTRSEPRRRTHESPNKILTGDEKQNTEERKIQTSSKIKEPAAFSKNANQSGQTLKSKHFVGHKSESMLKSKESPPLDKNHDHFKMLSKYHDKIVPGKATRQISTGSLGPPSSTWGKNGWKKPPSRRRKPSIVSRNMPIALQSFTAKSPQTKYPGAKKDSSEEIGFESDEEEIKTEEDDKLDDCSKCGLQPLFLKNLKHIIITPDNAFGGFCLFPGTFSSSRSKMDDFVRKTEDTERELPRVIQFDIDKFSISLMEMLKDHLEQNSELSETDEESTIVLSIVLDSLGKAINWYIKKDDSNASQSDEAETDSVEEILNIPMQDRKDEEQDFPTKDSFITKSKSDEGSSSLKTPFKKSNGQAISYACEICKGMEDPTVCLLDCAHTCSKNCLKMKSLRDSCFSCMHARERGLTIHQCHDSVATGVLEIRHMDAASKICVCYLIWNRKKELDDWRWQKNPFHDPTRVEIEQETNLKRNAILKVIFGPDATMLKESLAETHLQLVCDSAQYSGQDLNFEDSTNSHKRIPASTTGLYKHYRKSQLTSAENKLKQLKQQGLGDSDKKLLTKLGRFFDDIQKVGYGKGPPLVLKLRRKSAVYDAYDLLTVPSNIRLNYYRSLRALFISDYDDKVSPTFTNFQNEDEIYELFELFERDLFSSKEKSLFVHPSEETQCIYFNPDSNAHPQWFAFAGTVLALAILHQRKLDIKFPLCLFKCLLDRAVTIEDLKEIDPLVYQKLMWIRENDITSRQGMMTFTIKDEIGSNVSENELMVNGSKIAVTEKNKFRYIDLVVKWKLAERCLKQLKDFRRGFASVIDPGFLTNFTSRDLQSLIRYPPDPDIFLKECASGKFSEKIERRETL